MRWTKLTDIVPKAYMNVADIAAVVGTSDIDLFAFTDDAYSVYKNFFVRTCDFATIILWEGLLGLAVLPTMSVEDRRENVLLELANVGRLTLAWLTQKLNILVGEGLFTIEVDYPGYSVNVQITSGVADVVLAAHTLTRKTIPAHLQLAIDHQLCAEAASIGNAGCVANVATEYVVGLTYSFDTWSLPLGWAPLTLDTWSTPLGWAPLI